MYILMRVSDMKMTLKCKIVTALCIFFLLTLVFTFTFASSCKSAYAYTDDQTAINQAKVYAIDNGYSFFFIQKSVSQKYYRGFFVNSPKVGYYVEEYSTNVKFDPPLNGKTNRFLTVYSDRVGNQGEWSKPASTMDNWSGGSYGGGSNSGVSIIYSTIDIYGLIYPWYSVSQASYTDVPIYLSNERMNKPYYLYQAGNHPTTFAWYEYVDNGVKKTYFFQTQTRTDWENIKRAFYLDANNRLNLITRNDIKVRVIEFRDEEVFADTLVDTGYNVAYKLDVDYSKFSTNQYNKTYVFKTKQKAQDYLLGKEPVSNDVDYEPPFYTPPSVEESPDSIFGEQPKRSEYPDTILGALNYFVDSAEYYISIPFKLLASTFVSVGNFFRDAMSWIGGSNSGVIGFLTSLFSFLPPQVTIMLTGFLSVLIVFSIYKLFRG